MVLTLHASEALEAFIKTQPAEPHPLELLLCRFRVELTICIFNKLLEGDDAASQGPHFENWTSCYLG